jgi:hypothetical protein
MIQTDHVLRSVRQRPSHQRDKTHHQDQRDHEVQLLDLEAIAKEADYDLGKMIRNGLQRIRMDGKNWRFDWATNTSLSKYVYI